MNQIPVELRQAMFYRSLRNRKEEAVKYIQKIWRGYHCRIEDLYSEYEDKFGTKVEEELEEEFDCKLILHSVNSNNNILRYTFKDDEIESLYYCDSFEDNWISINRKNDIYYQVVKCFDNNLEQTIITRYNLLNLIIYVKDDNNEYIIINDWRDDRIIDYLRNNFELPKLRQNNIQFKDKEFDCYYLIESLEDCQ